MTSKQDTLRKAAILVASLDRQAADALLARVSPNQALRVRRAAVELGPIEASERDEVLAQFIRVRPMVPDKQPAGIELDRGLALRLTSSETDRRSADSLGGETRSDESSHEDAPFRFLHETQCDDLALLLARENPQAIAVVLAHVPPERAAELLAELPPDLQVDVVRRLVHLEQTDPEILREVERGVRAWICDRNGETGPRAAGLSIARAILRAADPRAERDILNHISRQDGRMAAELTRTPHAPVRASDGPPPHRPTTRRQPIPVYNFDDLASLDDAALGALVTGADRDIVVLALAGASSQFVDRVLGAIPAAQSTAFRNALNHLGPTPLGDVEFAQQELAQLVASRTADRNRTSGAAKRSVAA